MFEELERVALTVDVPQHGLQTGDVGMVLHRYAERHGYEVEFVTLHGEFIALVALYPTQIRHLEQDEIAHVRTLKTA
jgi:hypothetical protein